MNLHARALQNIERRADTQRALARPQRVARVRRQCMVDETRVILAVPFIVIVMVVTSQVTSLRWLAVLHSKDGHFD